MGAPVLRCRHAGVRDVALTRPLCEMKVGRGCVHDPRHPAGHDHVVSS